MDWRATIRHHHRDNPAAAELFVQRIELEIPVYQVSEQLVNSHQNVDALKKYADLHGKMRETRAALSNLGEWERWLLADTVSAPTPFNFDDAMQSFESLESTVAKWENSLEIVCRKLGEQKSFQRKGSRNKLARRYLVEQVAKIYAAVFDVELVNAVHDQNFKEILSFLLIEQMESATNIEQTIRQSFPNLKKKYSK
jgi:hypothetical protein